PTRVECARAWRAEAAARCAAALRRRARREGVDTSSLLSPGLVGSANVARLVLDREGSVDERIDRSTAALELVGRQDSFERPPERVARHHRKQLCGTLDELALGGVRSQ